MKKKVIAAIVLVLAFVLTASGCYTWRIAPNPNPNGQEANADATEANNPDDEPTEAPAETEAVTESPDNTAEATAGATEQAATPEPSADVTLGPDDTAAPSASVTETAGPSSSATAAPSASAGNTTAPTATPSPTPKPTATPTPTPAPTPAPTATPTAAPSGDFSDFSSSSINGYGTYTNAMFGNARVTMINFWATWCGPCIEELPDIQRLYNNYAGRAQIVTYLRDSSSEGAVDTALGIMSGLGVTLPVIRCNSSVRQAFGAHANLEALPVTFFVDSNGHILRIVSGAQSYETYAGILNGML